MKNCCLLQAVRQKLADRGWHMQDQRGTGNYQWAPGLLSITCGVVWLPRSFSLGGGERDLRQEQAGGMQFLHLSALQSSCRGPAPCTSLQHLLGRNQLCGVYSYFACIATEFIFYCVSSLFLPKQYKCISYSEIKIPRLWNFTCDAVEVAVLYRYFWALINLLPALTPPMKLYRVEIFLWVFHFYQICLIKMA